VPAYGATPPQPPAPSVPVAHVTSSPTGPEAPVLSIGEIAIGRQWVMTPNGTAPLAGSTWIGQDMTRTEQKIPTWAIIMAIVGFLACLLGLLFLLVKEQRTTGYFEVTFQSGAVRHVTQLPVSNAHQVMQYRQLVAQAQAMAAAA
jgi:hypothetical protein